MSWRDLCGNAAAVRDITSHCLRAHRSVGDPRVSMLLEPRGSFALPQLQQKKDQPSPHYRLHKNTFNPFPSQNKFSHRVSRLKGTIFHKSPHSYWQPDCAVCSSSKENHIAPTDIIPNTISVVNLVRNIAAKIRIMEFRKNQDHQCLFCAFKSQRASELQDHMRTHTQEMPFCCDKCKRKFKTKRHMNRHINRVHREVSSAAACFKKYKCSLCPYSTSEKWVLETHIRSHTGERLYPCQHPNCGYAAKKSSALLSHNAQKHEDERKFSCPVQDCSYQGKTKTAMRKHSLYTHSEIRPFSCDFEGCSYRAKVKEHLIGHKRGVHNGGHKPFACSRCNYRTATKSCLINHQLKHTEGKPFKCEFSGCTFSCKSKHYLSNHVQNRHAEKTLKCDFVNCVFTTARKFALRYHKNVVHCEKVYKCQRCSYRGATPQSLQNHIVKHMSNQRLPCQNKGCTFQGKNQVALKRHLRLHKSNLNCPVDGCGKVGFSKSYWERHMRTHDPTQRPFHCPLCPKHFFTNSDLLHHLKTHTEEKPLKCPACNYGCVGRARLVDHVRRLHSVRFPEFVFDEGSTCDHCGVNYGCAVGLVMHEIKLKTAAVVLPRLQIQTGP